MSKETFKLTVFEGRIAIECMEISEIKENLRNHGVGGSGSIGRNWYAVVELRGYRSGS
jgi:hypothetical protein